MMKNLIIFCWVVVNSSSIFAGDTHIEKYEEFLVQHVKNSINMAERGVSKLTPEILKISGMSSSKNRHFLNNVCSMPNSSYLEIGTWKGSTWISALLHNKKNILQAISIDNWSEYGGPEQEFIKNCARFLPGYKFQRYSVDSFKLNKTGIFSIPVNIYFYDGDHSALSQELAFTYYNDVLDDIFIAIVDDWNVPEVPIGTYAAFKKLNYQIVFEIVCPANHNCDVANWWNGFYIAVIKKK